jgi:hypothetical protein
VKDLLKEKKEKQQKFGENQSEPEKQSDTHVASY